MNPVSGSSFDDPHLAKALAFAALVVILAEGGLTTKWSDIKSSTALAGVLATVGVGFSVGLMTLFGVLRAGSRSVDRRAAGRGDLPDRRRRRVLGAPAGADPAAGCAARWRPSPA